MKFISNFLFLAGVLTGSGFGEVHARDPERSLTGQPEVFIIQGKPYVVSGFGKAQFGMTREEVRRVIAIEYPKIVGSVAEVDHPTEGTRSMTIVLPEMAPGPGPATINYIFSASTQVLMAIHVFWLQEGDPTPEARQKLIEAGSQLTAGVLGYQWKPLHAVRGHVLFPGTVVLFSGRDLADGGLEIRLDGIAMDMARPKDGAGNKMAPEHRPAPKGPARLRVSFVSPNAMKQGLARPVAPGTER